MVSKTIQLESRRLQPNTQQVTKIKTLLDQVGGLSFNKRIDYVFDGINTWEQGYNLATITSAFYPDRIETIDDVEYPEKLAMETMKVRLRQFRHSTQCQRLVLYPSRGPNEKGEWRYFNMQQIDDFSMVEKMDLAVIKALKRWVKHITNILENDPEQRNEEHKKQISEIRYELMLRKRILKQLEKKKSKKTVTVSEEGSEQENNETNEK